MQSKAFPLDLGTTGKRGGALAHRLIDRPHSDSDVGIMDLRRGPAGSRGAFRLGKS
ncbi:hypothetical protein BwSH20_77860 [Bradyrhizobium ottawaense]|nr:hypothetical protein BwSH20_77860 [Bradyrhizobium ottawaense]